MNDRTATTPILFHVGYHKTATTWFQTQLFQRPFGFHQVLSFDQAAELITDPLQFDFDAARARSTIDAQSDRIGLANVISNETLCGHPFYGGREGTMYAERIHEIAPHAKVLFTIREQKKIIVSTYIQYLSRGGSLSPKEFFGESIERYGYVRFNARHFLYDRLVKRYIDLFGEGRVLVVTLESFVKNPSSVLDSIARFAGADPSVASGAMAARRVVESPAEGVAPVLRRINHFRSGAAKREVVLDLGRLSGGLYRAVHRLGRVPRVKTWLRDTTPVSSVVRERFQGRFGASNRNLQALLGDRIDLAGDGYELSETGDGVAPSIVAGDGPKAAMSTG